MTTTQSEIEQLRRDMQKVRGEIEQLGATLGRKAKSGARNAGEIFCDAARDFRMDLRQTAEQISGTIDKNPLAAALGAFGLGMLLGRLIAHRR